MDLIEKDLEVTLSDNLRDMFAFDQNTLSGNGTFSVSDVFSSSRRMHYLYIYSSISGYARIGDTEAPALVMISFQCLSLTTMSTVF